MLPRAMPKRKVVSLVAKAYIEVPNTKIKALLHVTS
jgi:hypothetical protein